MGSLGKACKAFSQVLFGGEHADALIRVLDGKAIEEPKAPEKPKEPEPPPPAPVEAPKPKPDSRGDAVYTLVLLQREGRLIDFLQEDIEDYEDEQIGAAVREIHGKCKKTLEKHFEIQPIRTDAEGEEVEVPSGFDPSEIQLTGDVRGEPPVRGTVRHRGWRVAKVDLPERSASVNEKIICPCEVEV